MRLDGWSAAVGCQISYFSMEVMANSDIYREKSLAINGV